MKKRILSLTLSMMLLLITAVPALAFEPPIPTPYPYGFQTSADGFTDSPLWKYTFSASPLDFSGADLIYTGYSVYHSGNEDNLLSYEISAGTFTWTADGQFDAPYSTNLMNMAENYGFYHIVTNGDDSIYLEIPVDMEKGDYAVYCGCWHYYAAASVTATDTGRLLYGDNIPRMPHINGTYMYINY